jgi:hypothetical protein
VPARAVDERDPGRHLYGPQPTIKRCRKELSREKARGGSAIEQWRPNGRLRRWHPVAPHSRGDSPPAGRRVAGASTAASGHRGREGAGRPGKLGDNLPPSTVGGAAALPGTHRPITRHRGSQPQAASLTSVRSSAALGPDSRVRLSVQPLRSAMITATDQSAKTPLEVPHATNNHPGERIPPVIASMCSS